MSGAWTKRQFVGGTVALDFANTVCYRDDPGRCFDKITGPVELAGFTEAALQLSDAGGWDATAPSPDIDGIGFSLYLELREATDALLRPVARRESPAVPAFRTLLRLHQTLLLDQPLRAGGDGIEPDPAGRPSFALIVTHSALRLAGSPDITRLKLCPNCHWLFLDRSRNGSRRWCDMLVCGNRAKVQRHHAKRGKGALALSTGELNNGG
jgi:predicted RNA-binding Zn ribbon-like protein